MSARGKTLEKLNLRSSVAQNPKGSTVFGIQTPNGIISGVHGYAPNPVEKNFDFVFVFEIFKFEKRGTISAIFLTAKIDP